MSKQRRNGWRFSRIRKQRMITQPAAPEEDAVREETVVPEPEEALQEKTVVPEPEEALQEESAEPEPEVALQEKTVVPEPEEAMQEETVETLSEEVMEAVSEEAPEEKPAAEGSEQEEPAEAQGWLDEQEPEAEEESAQEEPSALEEESVKEQGWLDEPEPEVKEESVQEEPSAPEEESVEEQGWLDEPEPEAEEESIQAEAAEAEESIQAEAAEAEEPVQKELVEAEEPVQEESAEPDAEEPVQEESAEPEPEEPAEPEMEIVPEDAVVAEPEKPVVFGEETSAARELPARFFDEEDVEDTRVVRKKEKKRKKKGKKKARVIVVRKESDTVVTNPVTIGQLTLGDGIPKICIPVMGRTKEEILEQAACAKEMQPDIVEWRADHFSPVIETEKTHDILKELKELFGGVPLLFTYRTEGEGGFGRISWEQYAGLLVWAAGLQEVDLVDVEAMGLDVDTEGLIRAIHDKGTPVIASVHYFDGTPDKKELRDAVRFLSASGGDILKLAAMARSEKDVLDLMTWTYKQVRKIEQPLITVSMGDVGRLSRVSGRITGSAMTFGSANEASAPGQMPASHLRKALDQLGF